VFNQFRFVHVVTPFLKVSVSHKNLGNAGARRRLGYGLVENNSGLDVLRGGGFYAYSGAA
jgi:hypothetical protein